MHRGFVAICAVALGGAALWLGPAPAAAAPGTQEVTFGYTGAVQEFIVPEGVSRVSVEACGAGGGNTVTVLFASGDGGTGGRARSDVDVTPGEALRVRVGGAGSASAGGWNGGGPTGVVGGGGGGASDVRRGGDELGNRVVIGGGGGGGGLAIASTSQGSELTGGAGGGAVGADGEGPPSVAGLGATQAAPGPGGSLGVGASGAGGGGGGGLQGGGSGASMMMFGIYFSATGGGGSGLGDELATGACTSGAYVSISWEAGRSILPGGVLVTEGDGGSEVALLPVRLSAPADEPITIDWTTGSLPNQPGHAQAGQDFVAASGTVTFQPGETVAYVPVEFTDDDADEPNLLWGEWGVVLFSNPTGATLDTSRFFGAGLFIIVDDD